MINFIQKLFYPPYGQDLIVTYATIPETNILIYSNEIYKKDLLFLPTYFFFFLRKIFPKTPTGTYLFCSLSKISTRFEELKVQSVLYHKYQPHIQCAVMIKIFAQLFDFGYLIIKNQKKKRKEENVTNISRTNRNATAM